MITVDAYCEIHGQAYGWLPGTPLGCPQCRENVRGRTTDEPKEQGRIWAARHEHYSQVLPPDISKLLDYWRENFEDLYINYGSELVCILLSNCAWTQIST